MLIQHISMKIIVFLKGQKFTGNFYGKNHGIPSAYSTGCKYVLI